MCAGRKFMVERPLRQDVVRAVRLPLESMPYAMVEQIKGAGLREFITLCWGRWGQHLSGLFRTVFLMAASVERYPRVASILWQRYYQSGDLRLELLGNRGIQTEVWNWRSHHPLLCDVAHECTRVIFREMGCQITSTFRERCVSRGDPCCGGRYLWKPLDGSPD